MLTLYQAEWCPYSSAVREVLTELGIDFVARQVEPHPEQRATLHALTGKSTIPVLQTDDGQIFIGAREIFKHLETHEAWQYADEHREQWNAHRDARESDAAGRLLKRFRRDRPGPPVSAEPDQAEVVNVPGESRYELRLGDRRLGLAAYRRRDDTIAFTHTEIDAACEGRGFGTRLVLGALEDARSHGLRIVPLCPFVAAVARRHPEYSA
jgi:uncharacterized protein